MNNTNSVPFLDLVTPHQELKEELCSVFNTALATAGFIGGPMLEEFERAFAGYCETEHCVGVASGTDALRFALMAAGIGAGDIVVTVPNTFIATTEAISQAGAQPDFVDVDASTCNMDAEQLRKYLEGSCRVDDSSGRLVHKKSGKRVAAIVPVHLYGQTADMDPVLQQAERYHLTVIEDACQAHGARYLSRKTNRWQLAGSIGKAAAFSFYPGKNLGACGEAGAVTTSDAGLAQRIRMLRDHGQSRKYHHEIEGYNGRLDAIQAGILRTKLNYLPGWTLERRAAAARYRTLFAGSTVTLPFEPAWARAVYHLFVIRVQNRDGLIDYLNAAGIGTGIHYPIPLHLQNAYTGLGYSKGAFPVSEQLASQVLSLPMYPGLTADQQNRVVDTIESFVSNQQFMPDALAMR